MSEYRKEKSRLLRRAEEQTVILNYAATSAADAIYRLKVIHNDLRVLENKDKGDV